MGRKIIIANWKMYLGTHKAVILAKKIRDAQKKHEVIIAPSFTAIEEVAMVLAQSGIDVCAQNMFYDDYGAYTGEICGQDLLDIGCKYVILGHSERRKYFKETYEMVNKKLLRALKLGLKPIICVGEELNERRAGKTWDILKHQLKTALKGIKKSDEIIIAYEPIWAIGTGHPETPKDAEKIHKAIKKFFLDRNDKVVYGGSIDENNAKNFLKISDIDGLLVGGASANSDKFSKIIK